MNFRQIKEKQINEQSGELKDFIQNPLLCDLLLQRGIQTKKEAQAFLSAKEQNISSFDVFCDSKKAIERIKKAIENKEKILIWGDFDADGVTSSALLYKTLKALNAEFENFIPNREEHGHGLNSKAALNLVSKHKIKVLITVDCGISNIKEIALLKGLNVDVIVTDHHKSEGELPNAYAIINPQADNSLRDDLSIAQITDLSRLAGVAVAYKMALSLLGDDKKYDALKEELLILATVGTISDVVPLLGENRTIVTKGLELINKKKHKAIAKLFENNGRKDITSMDVAFVLTPRINAVGRLSTPDLAFDFLTQENESAIGFILEKLDNFNKIRQSLCENIFLEAKDMILKDSEYKKQNGIVIFKQDWHIGIIGIVASKLVEEFLKPVFIVTMGENNQGRCSIRSIGNYNVYEILKKNAELFLGYGGHALAGGFSFDLNMHSFDEIKNAILNTFEEYQDVEPPKNYIEVDKILEAKDINTELIEIMNLLEPCGQNNPPALFALKDTSLVNSKAIGKNANHLKFNCEKDGFAFECVKWNENELKVPPRSKLDIAFSPRLNSFNNQQIIQLNVEDIYCESAIKKTKNGLKIYDHRKKTGILKQIADYLKKDNPDITIWAKKAQTIKDLSQYPEIEKRFYTQSQKHEGVMFFDYPSNFDELKEALMQISPQKIHIMNDNFSEDINACIKSVLGMIKYSCNQKDGFIDIEKMSHAIGVSETFMQVCLEIFESLGAIEILDIDKIQLLKPINLEQILSHSMFEVLNEEFEKIIEFKKHLATDDINKMLESLVK